MRRVTLQGNVEVLTRHVAAEAGGSQEEPAENTEAKTHFLP